MNHPCSGLRLRLRGLTVAGLLLVALGGALVAAEPGSGLEDLANLPNDLVEFPDKESYSIVVNTDGFPYSYRDSDGRMKGFAVELVEAISRVMKLRFDLVPGDAGETTNRFLGGEADAIMIFSRSKERLSLADFSVPYLRMEGTLIVRKDDKRIHSVEDLKGRRVLVHRKSIGEAYLFRRGFEESDIQYVRSVPEALKAVNAGEGDATLATRLTAMSLAKYWDLKNLEPRGASLEGFQADYCIGVRKGDARLLARINEGLAVLKASGEFDQLYGKWFGVLQTGGYSKTQIMGALLVGLSLALMVSLIFGVRHRILTRLLRSREELYRGVFESAHEAILVMLPADAVCSELLVLQANRAAVRSLWLNTPVAEAAPLAALLERNGSLAAGVLAAARGEGPLVFGHSFEGVAGGLTHLMVSVSQAGSRWLAVLTDVTEMKEAQEKLLRSEQQLLQTQKLEAIGTLASGVAHDFNNILTGIMGNVELARMNLEDGQAVDGEIEQIMQSAERARHLVRQILTFSRKSEVRRELVDVAAVATEVVRFVRAAAPASIKITHLACPQLPKVEGDPTQLHQVLMNLCTNSVHAMAGKNGTLEISEELVTHDAETAGLSVPLIDGEYVRLSVRDTGCGMSPEVCRRIFDPFFTTKGPGEGTGLGLSVVHGIIQKHRGAVTVYSQPGEGTVFRVYLPIALAGAGNGSTHASTGEFERGQGERVLLVDDEEVILKSTTALLTRLGYHVDAYQNPLEAEAAFKLSPERFDVLLSDLTMPGLDGLSLVERLRAMRAGLPVLLMSGFIGETEMQRIGLIGFSGVIDKPVGMKQLAHLLRKALQHGPAPRTD